MFKFHSEGEFVNKNLDMAISGFSDKWRLRFSAC